MVKPLTRSMGTSASGSNLTTALRLSTLVVPERSGELLISSSSDFVRSS